MDAGKAECYCSSGELIPQRPLPAHSSLRHMIDNRQTEIIKELPGGRFLPLAFAALPEMQSQDRCHPGWKTF